MSLPYGKSRLRRMLHGEHSEARGLTKGRRRLRPCGAQKNTETGGENTARTVAHLYLRSAGIASFPTLLASGARPEAKRTGGQRLNHALT